MHDELCQVSELVGCTLSRWCSNRHPAGPQYSDQRWVRAAARIYIYMGGRVQSVMPSQHRPRLDGERATRRRAALAADGFSLPVRWKTALVFPNSQLETKCRASGDVERREREPSLNCALSSHDLIARSPTANRRSLISTPSSRRSRY